MRTLFVAISALVILLTSGCRPVDDTGRCKPHEIRQDPIRHDRFWVCNNDGTGETAVTAPPPPSNPNHNWS